MIQVPFFSVRDLVVDYGGVRAIDGVHLEINKGEIRGLIGPNGAGKSTFIDAVTGRRIPTAGQVQLGGEDITQLAVVARRMRGVSRSFQRTSIFHDMNVLEQVFLASHQAQAKDPERDAVAILEELDLLQYADWRAGDLGYGQQRRLDLALALVGSPSVLLLDEPMAGLTVTESRDLAQHLKRLARERNVTVLLVEHDMEVVFGISDRVTVLELGKPLAEGTPDEIRANPKVREAYLGSAA
ncbi:ABC transporter ATP-binding protein [Marinobacterium lutimaris]|uniref:Amino acid/amide ABC transporter ATP-binding protein 1, HAAT family n=1 Tax=Marinobacterium lutimaris TaxID=568106 RepID=A0A1H5XZE8_9GAMM|nr:ABC transporter ATP-binding protein [Marinobacterium lutimaris]SEG17081.1 amino acid/amide ABC transporter ATP-binding protein 1, HAAT family [Marinobacterium lutimaris]